VKEPTFRELSLLVIRKLIQFPDEKNINNSLTVGLLTDRANEAAAGLRNFY
jgi:hypothetical protein